MRLTQLVAEAYGCAGALNDAEAICAALTQGARAVGASIVREATHAYAPHGVTAILFLAESHFMVTTWPEHGYAVAEVFLCNEKMDPIDAWSVLEATLRPRETRFHRIPLVIAAHHD